MARATTSGKPRSGSTNADGVPKPVEPVTPAEAAAKIGVEPALAPIEAPSDTLTDADDSSVIRIANRSFSASRKKLSNRVLDVLPDLPDIRDRIYQPHLRALRPSRYPSIPFKIRDQGSSNSCTGYALAHAVDVLLHRAGLDAPAISVSARMLYEMAKLNDEWTGTRYEGSSIRGAISGFYRNGVCTQALADDDSTDAWILTYEIGKEARQNRIGAYYRLMPDLADYHAAIDEIGVIVASAQIHSGWAKPEKNRIVPSGEPAGGHAFAIVGYDAAGFWVLNSWGSSWGDDGIAHWSYEDWAATVMDAWVLQLGVYAPTAFSALPRRTLADAGMLRETAPSPVRTDIVGHFINIDDGAYVTGGRYYSPSPAEMAETVKRIADPKSNEGQGYQHLVIYAHGGLNSITNEANRIATWKRNAVFSRNGIYNFHLMWNTEAIGEVFGKMSEAQEGRAAGILGDLMLETLLRPLGVRAWRNMKQDAAMSFAKGTTYDGGFYGLKPLLQGLDKAGKRPLLHLVGHSAGAIMLGELLAAMPRFGLSQLELGSIHLMAPACTTQFFQETYANYLTKPGGPALKDKIHLYNLDDERELNDVVGWGGPFGYGRSLLYLVSRAYEAKADTALAGMQIFRKQLPTSDKIRIDYSSRANDKLNFTRSTSHGGFDNDVATLNTIMTRILGKAPRKPPTSDELTGY